MFPTFPTLSRSGIAWVLFSLLLLIGASSHRCPDVQNQPDISQLRASLEVCGNNETWPWRYTDLTSTEYRDAVASMLDEHRSERYAHLADDRYQLLRRFVYDNAASVQEDAYRIISFALERGSIGPGDKERCFRLWQEFVAPWFGLAPEWMHRPAPQFQAPPQAVSDDDDARIGSFG